MFQFIKSSQHLTILHSLLLWTFCITQWAEAGIVTFGSGANSFTMEFVDIGDKANAADTVTGYGGVAYTFRAGKTEVSNSMIAVYNALQDPDISTLSTVADRPAQGITFRQAAAFVNWMNEETGNAAAYNVDSGTGEIVQWNAIDHPDDYDASNPWRSTRSVYVLPTLDEFYKAAYYNPSASQYFAYPTGSDTAPTSVSSGTSANTAVFDDDPSDFDFLGNPAAINQAGGLSAYGVMGLGGNVAELSETGYDDFGDYVRFELGGSYTSPVELLAAESQGSGAQVLLDDESYDGTGFRVYEIADFGDVVPEPSSLIVLGLFAAGTWFYRRRQGSRCMSPP